MASSNLAREQRAAALRAPSRDMGPAKWLDVDGIRTRYFDQGTGERVAFFHGGNVGAPVEASTAQVWDMTLPPLSTQFNCIAVDRLGQGFTDNPKSDADYTMHASVQHAAAFLRTLDRAPYHLVGNSRGAYLVCRLALENPDLVKSCVLVSTSTLSPGLSRNPVALADPPLPLQTRESQRWIYENYSYNPRIVTEDWLDETQAVVATERNRIAIRKMMDEGLEKRQYMPELRRQRFETYRWILERGMPCPTLIACAINDPSTDFDNMKLLIEMLMARQPRTEVRVFNRAGHYVYREQSPAFNGMVLDFVRSNS